MRVILWIGFLWENVTQRLRLKLLYGARGKAELNAHSEFAKGGEARRTEMGFEASLASSREQGGLCEMDKEMG